MNKRLFPRYKVYRLVLNGRRQVKVPVAWAKTLEEARSLLDAARENGQHLLIDHI